ncbi:MAG: hypothetical protein ABEK01_05855 [Candidatus Nanohaloarchaea archaeon]
MIYLTVSLALGFLTTLIGTPYARKYLLLSKIYGKDQQKPGKPRLPTSGGVAVLFGFVVSVSTYLGLVSFLGSGSARLELILASLSSVTIISIIGLIDDIHINVEGLVREETGEDIEVDLGASEIETPTDRLWDAFTSAVSRGDVEESAEVHREGLSQLPKMLFVLPAAFPLIAVGAGSWSMSFPVVGAVHWGIFYPLFLLPVGLLFVSNVINMLAGTNGLSAGMSFVASTALGVFASLNGRSEAALIAFSISVSLLAFLRYNRYPASILPGDSLTYLSGAAIFSAIVIGNMEKFGVFIFLPWIAEFFLKLRSGFSASSWGILQDDGSLKPQHEKTYSLTHPLMRRGLTERQVTLVLTGTETLICVVGILLFAPIP